MNILGRGGYEVLEEEKKEKIERCGCGTPLMNCEKFCPECGVKCEKA